VRFPGGPATVKVSCCQSHSVKTGEGAVGDEPEPGDLPEATEPVSRIKTGLARMKVKSTLFY